MSYPEAPAGNWLDRWLAGSLLWRLVDQAEAGSRRWVRGSALDRGVVAVCRAAAGSRLLGAAWRQGPDSAWAGGSRILAGLAALLNRLLWPLGALWRAGERLGAHPAWQGSLVRHLWTVDAGVAFLLAFVPVSYGLFGVLPYSAKYAAEGVLGLLVLATLAQRAAGRQPWRWSAPDVPVCFLLTVALVSAAVNGSNPVQAVAGIRAFFQYYLLAWVVTQAQWTPHRLWRLVCWTGAVGAVLALYGIAQWVMGVPTPAGWVDVSEAAAIRTRAFSTFGNPNTFAAYLALLLGPAAALWTARPHRPSARLAVGLALAVGAAALVFTYSRSAWMGFGLAALVVGLVRDRRLPLLMGAAVVALPAVAPTVAARLLNALSPVYLAKSLSGGRLEWWRKAVELWRLDPLFGIGPGAYGGAAANYFGSKAYLLVNLPERIWELWVDSQLVQFLAELGTLGLLGFAWLLVTAWALAHQVWRGAPEPWRSLALGGGASLLGIALMSGFASLWEMQPVATLLWWQMALLAVLAREGQQWFPMRPEG